MGGSSWLRREFLSSLVGRQLAPLPWLNASIHKLVELYEERQADPNHPALHTVVILRAPEDVPPASCAALR